MKSLTNDNWSAISLIVVVVHGSLVEHLVMIDTVGI